MKTKWLLLSAIVAIGAIVFVLRRESVPADTGLDAVSAKVEWLTDFGLAQRRALAENKPLLIDFTGSDWCPPCILLERQVFSQGEFVDYAARNLILLKIDFPRRRALPADQQAANHALAQRFAIRGFPTILAMGADGKLKGQVATSMFNSPAEFIANFEEIVRKS